MALQTLLKPVRYGKPRSRCIVCHKLKYRYDLVEFIPPLFSRRHHACLNNCYNIVKKLYNVAI